MSDNSDDRVTKILQDLQAGTITQEESIKALSNLTKKTNSKQVTLKVTPKGCIGIYGVRRMPISLYFDELNSILNYILTDGYKFSEQMNSFLTENESKLAKK